MILHVGYKPGVCRTERRVYEYADYIKLSEKLK